MSHPCKYITHRCSCGCCLFVAERHTWDSEETDFSLSIMDDRYDHNFNTLWGRLKRAAAILFGNPVRYNELFLESRDDYRKLLEDMTSLLTEE